MFRLYLLVLLVCLSVFVVSQVFGGVITIEGTQHSDGNLHMNIGRKVIASKQGLYGFSFLSPCLSPYALSPKNLNLSNMNINYVLPPSVVIDTMDTNGNHCKKVLWGSETGPIIYYPDSAEFVIVHTATATMDIELDGLNDPTPYPYTQYPDSVLRFIQATPQVQSDNSAIINFARSHFLPVGATQVKVVNEVVRWATANITYVHPPPALGALEIFSDTLSPPDYYRTNCIGIAHLTMAFLRALGIPVRYVNGFMLDGCSELPWKTGTTIHCTSSASHAWIEVYFPVEGWIPYDPQVFYHFVDALRYKYCYGLDYVTAHPEDNVATAIYYLPDPLQDWFIADCCFVDSSSLNCPSIYCTVDSLTFLSYDNSIIKGIWADSACIPDSFNICGDVNFNGVPFEIADAVMFTNYFIDGYPAFEYHVDHSIVASDANQDGINLSVADLVFMVLVIMGEMPPPITKISDTRNVTFNISNDGSYAYVNLNSSNHIGGALLIFDVNGTVGNPRLLGGAKSMDVRFARKDNEFRVLIYSMHTNSISSGNQPIMEIPYQGSIGLSSVEAADCNGRPIKAFIAGINDQYSLCQNAPNPFNMGTIINANIPNNSAWEIRIYNICGQLVRKFTGVSTSGLVSVFWNGADNSGAKVASGIYFYKLNAGDFTETKNMMLIK